MYGLMLQNALKSQELLLELALVVALLLQVWLLPASHGPLQGAQLAAMAALEQK
jgi:hypothetical protein